MEIIATDPQVAGTPNWNLAREKDMLSLTIRACYDGEGVGLEGEVEEQLRFTWDRDEVYVTGSVMAGGRYVGNNCLVLPSYLPEVGRQLRERMRGKGHYDRAAALTFRQCLREVYRQQKRPS